MRTPALAVALALVVMPGVPAVAKPVPAPKPQIRDDEADQRGLGPGYDIRSALFTTAGTMVRSGKKTTYVPNRLVVAVTYSAPPSQDLYAAQVVAFATSSCRVYLEIYGVDRRTYGSGSCAGSGGFAVPVNVSGNVLTISLPFSALGTSLRAGVELRELETWTNVAEPTDGYEPGDLAGSAFTVDVASTDVTYTIR